MVKIQCTSRKIKNLAAGLCMALLGASGASGGFDSGGTTGTATYTSGGGWVLSTAPLNYVHQSLPSKGMNNIFEQNTFVSVQSGTVCFEETSFMALGGLEVTGNTRFNGFNPCSSRSNILHMMTHGVSVSGGAILDLSNYSLHDACQTRTPMTSTITPASYGDNPLITGRVHFFKPETGVTAASSYPSSATTFSVPLESCGGAVAVTQIAQNCSGEVAVTVGCETYTTSTDCNNTVLNIFDKLTVDTGGAVYLQGRDGGKGCVQNYIGRAVVGSEGCSDDSYGILAMQAQDHCGRGLIYNTISNGLYVWNGNVSMQDAVLNKISGGLKIFGGTVDMYNTFRRPCHHENYIDGGIVVMDAVLDLSRRVHGGDFCNVIRGTNGCAFGDKSITVGCGGELSMTDTDVTLRHGLLLQDDACHPKGTYVDMSNPKYHCNPSTREICNGVFVLGGQADLTNGTNNIDGGVVVTNNGILDLRLADNTINCTNGCQYGDRSVTLEKGTFYIDNDTILAHGVAATCGSLFDWTAVGRTANRRVHSIYADTGSKVVMTQGNNTVCGYTSLGGCTGDIGVVAANGAIVELYGTPGNTEILTNVITSGVLAFGDNAYVAMGNGVIGRYGCWAQPKRVIGHAGTMQNFIYGAVAGLMGCCHDKEPVVDLSNTGIGNVVNTDVSGTTTGAPCSGMEVFVFGNGVVDMCNLRSGTVQNFVKHLYVNIIPEDPFHGIADLANYGSGDVTNVVTDGMHVAGSGTAKMFNTRNCGTTTNTITGCGIKVCAGGTADLHDSMNTVHGGIVVHGSNAAVLDMHNSSSQDLTNDVCGGLVVKGGYANFKNLGSGTLTNRIDGGIAVTGGQVHFTRAQGAGELTNTVCGKNDCLYGDKSITVHGSGEFYMNTHIELRHGILLQDYDEASPLLDMCAGDDIVRTIHNGIEVEGGTAKLNGGTNAVCGEVKVCGGELNMNHSGNTFDDGIAVWGGTANFLCNVHNTFNGSNCQGKSITVGGTGELYMDNDVTIPDGLEVKGTGILHMDYDATRTIHNGICVTGGQALLGNGVNDVCGHVSVRGGTLNMRNATNTFDSCLRVHCSGVVDFSAREGATGSNTFNGGLNLTTIADGDNPIGLDFSAYDSSDLTNTFNDCVVVNGGSMNLGNRGSGTVTNNYKHDFTVTGGVVAMSNVGSGAVNNTFGTCKNLNISGGTVDVSNRGTGTVTNTLGKVNLSGNGMLIMGGNGETTTISKLHWTGSDASRIALVYNNGNWGDNTITDFCGDSSDGGYIFVLTDASGNVYGGDPNLVVPYAAATSQDYPAGSKVCLKVLGGDVDELTAYSTVENHLAFWEFDQTSAGYGISWAPDGSGGVTLSATFRGTEVTVDTTPGNVIDGITSIVNTIQQLQKDSETSGTGFANSSMQINPESFARMRMKLQNSLRSKQNPWESLVMAMSEGDEGPKVMKFKGDYRVFLAPYHVNTRNTGSAGAGTGFNEKDYGGLLGASHFVKSIGTNVTALLGFGLIDQQMSSNKNSKTKGKQLLLGLTTNKKLFTDYEWISSLYGIMNKRNQDRQGNPSAVQSYLAQASYKTYLLSWQNELGRAFKLQDNWSVRPLVGVQIGVSKRTAFSETLINVQGNVLASNVAQSYRAKTQWFGEAYTGVGVRKKWEGERLEGKITCAYEVGQKSGNGKSRTDVSAGNQTLSASSSTPGRFTQYINLYGSLLDKQTGWKVIPSATLTLQRGQRSLTSSLKFEYRF